MSGSKRELFLVCFCFLTLGGPLADTLAQVRAMMHQPSTRAPKTSACSTRLPATPGTHRPASPPGRAGPGDALVSKARITPHWFHQNNRFWYRNDLAAGKREFILVDAEDGTRGPAFDHQKLAAALAKASAAAGISADKLPFDAIEFADDGKSIRFRVGETTWRCDLDTYDCTRSQGAIASDPPAGEAADAGRVRPGRRGDGSIRSRGNVGAIARQEVDCLHQGPQRLPAPRGRAPRDQAHRRRQGGHGLRSPCVVARFEHARGLARSSPAITRRFT